MKRKGFTLIELIVVLAIIGILATIILVSYNGIQKVSRDAQRKTDLNAIASAMLVYYSEEKTFSTINDKELQANNVLVTEKFLLNLPTDPSGNLQYWIERNSTEAAVYADLETTNREGDQCFLDTAVTCRGESAVSGSYDYGRRVKPE